MNAKTMKFSFLRSKTMPTKCWRFSMAKTNRRTLVLKSNLSFSRSSSPLPENNNKHFPRNAYMMNRWYPAALSSDIKPHSINQGKPPYQTEILGRSIIIFRNGEGFPQCVDGVCPHRGAPLGKGKIIGNSVSCPYHGWEFDGACGALTRIPSCASCGKMLPRVAIPSYWCEEKGGFIWLFFENQNRMDDSKIEIPPIPHIPELDAPDWKPVYGKFHFKAPHWTVFDNAIDMTHIHYLHNSSFGDDANPVIRYDNAIWQDAHKFIQDFTIKNKPVSPLWEWTRTGDVQVRATVFLPSTSSIQIFLGKGVSMITFVSTVPVNKHESVNYYALIRNFLPWKGFDKLAVNAMENIFKEDKDMVELLKPDTTKEISIVSIDKPQIILRNKKMRAWLENPTMFE